MLRACFAGHGLDGGAFLCSITLRSSVPMNNSRFLMRAPAAAGPPALLLLVIISAGAHVLRTLFSLPTAIPAGALSMDSLLRGEWWTVLTYMFTHKDTVHLLTNLLLLVMAGRAVERHVGGRHLLYIFLFSAWAGAGLHLALFPDSTPIAGASGAVFGVIGAFIALFPEYDLMRPFRGVLPGRLKARRLFPALLIVFVSLELLRRFQPGIEFDQITKVAHLVHTGGLVAGWFYGRWLAADDPLATDTGNDFFPQGLRRRSREMDEALPVAAGLPPRREEREQDNPPAPPRELTDAEFLSERVDPVLEKLHDRGAAHLTANERAILDEASRRFGRKKN